VPFVRACRFCERARTVMQDVENFSSFKSPNRDAGEDDQIYRITIYCLEEDKHERR